jgi:glycosyltransferase involved in cell wall biosynthesis
VRVLVLSDLYPPVAFGGYELECAALVDRLRERHDVTVLTTDLRASGQPAEEGVLRELPFMGGRLRPALTAPAAALRTARITREALARARPDVVYVSNGAALPQAAIQIAASAGARVVVRFSELWYARHFLSGDRFLRHLAGGEGGARAVWGAGLRAVNRRPALRLEAAPRFPAAISWASAALRDLAGVPSAIELVAERVIHPATPRHAVFAAVERRPAPEPLVAYIGRLTGQKGADVAVRAVGALRRDGVEARLVMAGPGSAGMQRDLARLAASEGIELELTGALDTDGVAALLARASVVLVPSVEPEAFPLTVVEAALARAPIVATDVGGIPEGFADAEHALLVAPGDPAAAAAALRAVLDDPAQAAARADRARARAEQFTLGAYLDASEELIASVA